MGRWDKEGLTHPRAIEKTSQRKRKKEERNGNTDIRMDTWTTYVKEKYMCLGNGKPCGEMQHSYKLGLYSKHKEFPLSNTLSSSLVLRRLLYR